MVAWWVQCTRRNSRLAESEESGRGHGGVRTHGDVYNVIDREYTGVTRHVLHPARRIC